MFLRMLHVSPVICMRRKIQCSSVFVLWPNQYIFFQVAKPNLLVIKNV